MRLSLRDAAPIGALRALLRHDRQDFAETIGDTQSSQADRTTAREYVVLIDRLDRILRSGGRIDLATPRSAKSAEWDGGEQTVGGYLLCLVRDEYNAVHAGEGWERLADLGPVVVQITPLLRPTSDDTPRPNSGSELSP